MSVDLSMNDTCPKCRKEIKLTAIRPHSTDYELAVHTFGCANCGCLTTKTFYRRPAIEAT